MVNAGVQALMERRRKRLQTLLEQLAQHGQRLREYLTAPGILREKTKRNERGEEREND